MKKYLRKIVIASIYSTVLANQGLSPEEHENLVEKEGAQEDEG